jgi:hypothetical protein
MHNNFHDPAAADNSALFHDFSDPFLGNVVVVNVEPAAFDIQVLSHAVKVGDGVRLADEVTSIVAEVKEWCAVHKVGVDSGLS